MRYSNAKMTGAVPQAASGMATAGSKAALAGAVSDIILGVNERQIAPGETARFPFVACTAYGIPSIHEFNVITDNPNFNPAWVRLGPSAGDCYSPRYILEISPADIGRYQYGAYPLRLSWRAAGTYRHAGGRCTLIIRPCVRAVTEPVVSIWPTGRSYSASVSVLCLFAAGACLACRDTPLRVVDGRAGMVVNTCRARRARRSLRGGSCCAAACGAGGAAG